jgi:hypothetical protein
VLVRSITYFGNDDRLIRHTCGIINGRVKLKHLWKYMALSTPRANTDSHGTEPESLQLDTSTQPPLATVQAQPHFRELPYLKLS